MSMPSYRSGGLRCWRGDLGRKSHCWALGLFLASWMAMASWPSAVRASDAGLSCTLKEVTCGGIKSTFAGLQGCTFVRLANVGDAEVPPLGVELTAFVGVHLDGNVLVLGGASFEKSIRFTCVFGPKAKGNKSDAMVKALLEALKKNPELKKKYPNVTKLKLDKNFSFRWVDPETGKKLDDAFRKDN